jgi:hypothetical protein
MSFRESEEQRRFQEAWQAVAIVRSVPYSLFTFGESILPYYLVCGEAESREPVTITQGEVRVQRPVIITPDNARPELSGFFDNPQEEGIAEFLLARTAHFSNYKFANRSGTKRSVSHSVDEVVDQLNEQLDQEDEDRLAILTAPPNLGGVAVLRYAAERVWESTPSNIQELRERGFLP